MTDSSAIRQHQTYARTGDVPGDGDNFGVQDFASFSRGNGYSGKTRGHMKDGARGAGKPIEHTRGRHPAQAAPDHGAHYDD